MNTSLSHNIGVNYLSTTKSKRRLFVYFWTSYSTWRSVFSVGQGTSESHPLDHTQNHRLFSELLSALAWLNVTGNCLLSHNTSWAHRRGTLGFPPEAARRTEQNVIKRHEKRRTAARWALPLVVDGGLLLVLWPGGAKAHDDTELEFSLRKS